MTLFHQLSDSSSQMDKHVSQYLVNTTKDCKASLLRSILARPPQTQAPCHIRPQCQAEEPESGSEWTSVVNVPFGPHRRIKWTWSAHQETAAHLMVDNHQQTGARTVVFKPLCANGKFASFETFAVMGDRPLRRNAFTYWEVEVGNLTLRNATSVMVGLGTKQARTRSCGYLNLIGIDEQSWGLSNKGFLWHNNRSTAYCKPLGADDQESTIIGLLYDGLNGQLTFYINGASAGRAFVGLGKRHAELYPMISSTASNSRFKMGPVHESIPTLKDLCRDTVLASMSPSSWNQQQLLPKSLVQFLN